MRSPYNVDGTVDGAAEWAAFLVCEDMDGFGPELTEINTRTPGEYLYYVKGFAGAGTLAGSAATVTVTDRSVLAAPTMFTAPDGTGDHWSVFALTVSATGAVTVTSVNQISVTEPTLATPPPVMTL